MSKPTALGCYIFQGSFSLGVEPYFNILATLEDGTFGEATTRLNFDHEIHNVVEDWPLTYYRDKINFMYANPPCAPFSPMGGGMKGTDAWRTDDRISCWKNLIEAALVVQPDVFVGESVPKLYTNGWELVKAYTKDLIEAGYPRIYYVLHDIKFMGAPQQRRRFFFVASKYGLQWPVPNHPQVTFNDALESLEDPGPYKMLYDEFAEMYHIVPPGGGVRELFFEYYGGEDKVKEMGLRKPRFVLHKVNPELPTGTIFGHTVLSHPTEPRYLGVRELGRLMGYPDDYKWSQDFTYDPDNLGPYHSQLAKNGSEMVKAVTSFAGRYAAKTAADGIANKNKVIGRPIVTEIKRWAGNTRVINYEMDAQDTDRTEDVLG